VSDEMSDIGRALASGYGRDFNAANARLVRAGDDAVDNDELSVFQFILFLQFSLSRKSCVFFCFFRRADDMADQDDEMDDLVNELAALEVDPLKRFVNQFSFFFFSFCNGQKKKKKKKKKKKIYFYQTPRSVWICRHRIPTCVAIGTSTMKILRQIRS
jgi:hypothetical protein